MWASQSEKVAFKTWVVNTNFSHIFSVNALVFAEFIILSTFEMPLKIVVIGGGIAGLVAAISLRQAGHNVAVIEKYGVSSVVGAALHLNPNGNRVLSHLGFDYERAKACRIKHCDILCGQDMKEMSSLPLEKTPGHPEPGTFTIHRGDLHQELMALATTKTPGDNADWGSPVNVYPESAVSRISDDGSAVVLENGKTVPGDLIVGADGVHSVVRQYVVQEPANPTHSGMAAFRFLLDSDKLRADDELAMLLQKAKGRANLLVDTTETEKERHMVWYACHG